MLKTDEMIKIFSGDSSSHLSSEICKCLSINEGEMYKHTFPSGEKYVQYKENIRGADVFLIAATSFPANDNLMQLLVMIDAAKRASAGRITAVIPYFGYSRQDRKDKPRVPISAKLVMDILLAAGVNRVLTMDLHAQQIQGFFDGPVDHLYFQPVLATALKHNNIQVVVSPDTGGIKKASEYAEKEGLDLAMIVKQRKNDTTVKVKQFVGDVRGKNVLLIDDLTESAGTLIAGAEVCRFNGANKVYCAVTHGCFSDTGKERLQKAYDNGIINQLYCSNTVTEMWKGNIWGTVVSIAPLFADAIRRIHSNESVNELFK